MVFALRISGSIHKVRAHKADLLDPLKFLSRLTLLSSPFICLFFVKLKNKNKKIYS